MKKIFLVLLSTILLLASSSLSAKNYYRYTDADGKLVVKDYLPTEAVKVGYDIITETGRLVEKVPAALTREQRIAESIRQEQLKLQADKRRKERQKDTLLLRQYSTVDDIERTKKSQTSTLNINLRIIANHTNSLKRKLQEQEKRAADYERQGKAVPEMTLHEIAAIKTQISANNDSVERYESQIANIDQQFQKDRIRFQELKAELFVENSLRDVNDIDVQDIYDCADKISCDKAWSYAQIFALENATHALSIVTNTLIVSKKPRADNEIGLTITRVPQKNEVEAMNIVINVNCNPSEEGRKLCQSNEVIAIKQKFIDYLSANS
ncbi:hypothetical protein [Kangiella sp. HZ709]|uniref:hypothetical protein n=1 Tax=Kangiella sp. HZ709 TaxID=2666328 RepID=UPI0014163B3F|nr:hypothetical protein [Kangiella sp. HZ709]